MRAAAALAGLACLLPRPAAAAQAAASAGEPPGESAPAEDARELREELEAQRRELEALRARAESDQRSLRDRQSQLDRQQAELARQRRLLEEQESLLKAQAEAVAALEARLDALAATLRQEETERSAALDERLARIEGVVARVPESAEIVQAGELPGSIRIPGTGASLKVGGFVKAVGVWTFDPLGSDDRFVTASIPPSGAEDEIDEPRFRLAANQTRLNLDVRHSTAKGPVRAFVEVDAAGAGNAVRLRHAFGQYRSVLVGQTWSTLVDSESVPASIDFEGLPGWARVRQAQIRWSRDLSDGLQLAIGFESADADVTGGRAFSKVPDVILRLSRAGTRRRVQGAVLLRNLTSEPTADPGRAESAFAWGAALSGRFLVGQRSDRPSDSIMFQLNAGDGIGRYINDLGAAGGQDGAFDPETGELEPLRVAGGYVAYEHWWRGDLRSSLIMSGAWVDNLEFQDELAFRRSARIDLNLLYSPTPRVDFGAEALWGRRVNRDGSRGQARQLQLAVTYHF